MISIISVSDWKTHGTCQNFLNLSDIVEEAVHDRGSQFHAHYCFITKQVKELGVHIFQLNESKLFCITNDDKHGLGECSDAGRQTVLLFVCIFQVGG